MTDERRKLPRAPGVLDGLWFGTGMPCRISGLNTAGCYIESLSPPQKGTQIRAELKLPQGTLSVQGEVLYADPRMGFAISFLDLQPEAHVMLKKAVDVLTEYARLTAV